MKKLLIFSILLLSMCAMPPQISPGDDAYHYKYFQDGQYDAFYIEWWYFNVFAEDIQVIFSYPIIDPEDISGLGLAGVTAVAYTERGVVSEANYFSPNQLDASYAEADVSVPDTNSNYVRANEDDGSYHIVGSVTGEHTISWDLWYDRQTDPWFARDREKVGVFSWEVMSWLVYMPSAWVNGTVIVDGQAYDINAPGYHDHNWGEWIPTNALWNWAQCYDPETFVSFEMGDFRSKPIGVASIEFGDDRIDFEKDEYILMHTKWSYDSENKKHFPVESRLYAEKKSWRLIVKLQTINTNPILSPSKLSAFLPKVVLYEQTAFYEGQLWYKNYHNEWELLTLFRGNGFKEYTTTGF